MAASRSGAGVNPAAAGARFGAAGPRHGQTVACRLSVQASSSLGEGPPAAESTPSLRSSGLEVPPPLLEDLTTLQNLQQQQPAQQPQAQANNIVSGCLGACLPRAEGLPAAVASSSSDASSEVRAWSAAAELASVTPSCFRTAAAAARSEPGQLDGMHKPVGLVVGSAWLMTATVQLAGERPPCAWDAFAQRALLTGVPVRGAHTREASAEAYAPILPSPALHWPAGAAALSPVWLPLVAGGALGGLYSAANHIGVRRLWRSPTGPLRVVVTGGSTGIGKALAREFLRWVLHGWMDGQVGGWVGGCASAAANRHNRLAPQLLRRCTVAQTLLPCPLPSALLLQERRPGDCDQPQPGGGAASGGAAEGGGGPRHRHHRWVGVHEEGDSERQRGCSHSQPSPCSTATY